MTIVSICDRSVARIAREKWSCKTTMSLPECDEFAFTDGVSRLSEFFPGGVVFESAFEAAVGFSDLPIPAGDKLATWMDYLGQTGQRYCALALEQIFPCVPDIDPDEGEAVPDEWESFCFDEFGEEEMCQFDGVPGEPLPEGIPVELPGPRLFDVPAACKILAQALADKIRRGEVETNDDIDALLAAISSGEGVDEVANAIAERANRFEIFLSAEESALLSCLLEPEPAQAPAPAAAPPPAPEPELGVWMAKIYDGSGFGDPRPVLGIFATKDAAEAACAAWRAVRPPRSFDYCAVTKLSEPAPVTG